MKSRPILMSPEMIRAYKAVQKNQTRRVIVPQPPDPFCGAVEGIFDRRVYEFIYSLEPQIKYFPNPEPRRRVACPYGIPDDLLWFRETWRTSSLYDPFTPRQIDSASSLYYKANDCAYRINRLEEYGPEVWGRWRSARFMPRWASRFEVPILSIRAERVQDITEEDALNEGIDVAGIIDDPRYLTSMTFGQLVVEQYALLWDRLNSKRGYPWHGKAVWVWRIEFPFYQKVTP